jgi:hypothetical protein
MTRVERDVFLDAAYAIALASTSDQHHAKAMALAEELERARTRLVTTHAVLLEIGNALAKRRYRAAAVDLLSSLDKDSTVDVVPLTPELYQRGFALYQSRMDKEWGLIDCVSFVVMNDRGLKEALTPDEHFEQAGFNALLRE